jgi:hypothetical protein
MILLLFAFFFGLAFLFITLAQYVKRLEFFIAGAVIIFIISQVFLFGYLEIPNGSISTSYLNTTTNITTITEIPQYTQYSNHIMSFALGICGIVTLGIGIFEYWAERKRKNEN